MKKLFVITIFFLLNFNNAEAQKIHFTDSTNYWKTTGYDCGFNPIAGFYWYSKDTIMNGFEYRYLKDSLLDYGCFCYIDTGYWVREDTIAHMVYVWIGDTDKVLYNFNLRTGDTLNYSFLPYPFWYIDTIYNMDHILIDTVDYKVWNEYEVDNLWHGDFDTPDCSGHHQITYIEDIGCIINPLYPINDIFYFSAWEKLQCFHQLDTPVFNVYMVYIDAPEDSILVYKNCGPPANIKEIIENNANNISVFPNPATTLINFQFSTPVDATIKITNIEGQVLQTVPVSNATIATINIAGYAPGMYLYQVVTKAETKVGKVVKE